MAYFLALPSKLLGSQSSPCLVTEFETRTYLQDIYTTTGLEKRSRKFGVVEIPQGKDEMVIMLYDKIKDCFDCAQGKRLGQQVLRSIRPELLKDDEELNLWVS